MCEFQVGFPLLYCLNRLIYMAVPKLMLTEFGNHYRLESCEPFGHCLNSCTNCQKRCKKPTKTCQTSVYLNSKLLNIIRGGWCSIRLSDFLCLRCRTNIATKNHVAYWYLYESILVSVTGWWN